LGATFDGGCLAHCGAYAGTTNVAALCGVTGARLPGDGHPGSVDTFAHVMHPDSPHADRGGKR